MAQFKNFYTVLEIPAFSEGETVKAAYRKLARQFHPDLHPNDKVSEEAFKAINEAYTTLSDAERKSRYDHVLKAVLERKEDRKETRTDFSNQSSPQSSTQAGTQSSNQYSNQSTASAHKHRDPVKKKRPEEKRPEGKTETQQSSAAAFNHHGSQKGNETPHTKNQQPFPESSGNGEQGSASAASTNGGFGQFFDALFKNKPSVSKSGTASNNGASSEKEKDEGKPATASGKTHKTSPVAGTDLNVELELTPEEALSGCVKPVLVQHQEVCRRCSGTGRLNGVMCPTCQGEKRLLKPRKLEVKIPAGVKPGSKIRIAKEGAHGQFGGSPGDLFIIIRLIASPDFRVEGINVYSDLLLSIPKAVLGGEVEVLTMHGLVKATIPPLSSSGQTLRLKGQGQRHGNQKGDHLVKLRIVSPPQLSDKERQLYEALRQEEGKHVRQNQPSSETPPSEKGEKQDS